MPIDNRIVYVCVSYFVPCALHIAQFKKR